MKIVDFFRCRNPRHQVHCSTTNNQIFSYLLTHVHHVSSCAIIVTLRLPSNCHTIQCSVSLIAPRRPLVVIFANLMCTRTRTHTRTRTRTRTPRIEIQVETLICFIFIILIIKKMISCCCLKRVLKIHSHSITNQLALFILNVAVLVVAIIC